MLSYLIGGLLHHQLKTKKMNSALITGANRSIGLETAKQLSEKDYLFI
jgi:short-subunit dehydrogenase